ncbi:ABC transporter ATP-binding protein, partial [Candidatus Saccharibacteria bacterium]|nr:ABC transporter ATP-binding protein [Candidatus Saccharibacteria bacterium]
MLKLLKYAKPYIWMILALAILTYVQVIANLKLPDYTAKIIDDGVIAEQISAIYSNGGMMLLVSLLGGLASVGVGYLAARIATGFARDIRLKAFKNVESFSASEFNTFSTASLITRSTNDVQQVQMVMVMLLRMALMAPFMAVGALQNAINSAPELSWIIAVGVGAVIAMVIFLFGMALPKFKLLQKMVDRLNLVTRENLTGLRVVRAFNREHTEEKKFDTANTDLMNLNLFVNRLMVLMQPFMMLVMNMSLVAIVWFGAQQISTETIAIGNMLAFMQYAMQAIMSFLMFSIIFIMVPRAAVSAGRINEVIETQSSIRDPAKPKKLAAKGQGRVEFREVTYTYPGAENPVLSGISFVAEPGQTTAFIGSTGSGKTTLINLIPRFFDVSAG